MREITTLTLEGRGLLRRLVRLRPRAVSAAWTRRSLPWLARAAELAIILTGWVLLPALPFLAAAIARDRDYVRRYPASLVQLARHIRATWRGRVLTRILLRKFEPTALRQPQRIVGSCTHCGNCCLYRSCVFLRFDAEGRSSCRIYGTQLWQGLTCGKYPVDAEEIDLYACPSFTAVPEANWSARRVIPVVSVNSSSRRDTA
jgi:hypothetical protein